MGEKKRSKAKDSAPKLSVPWRWVYIHGVVRKFAGDKPMRTKLVEIIAQGSHPLGQAFVWLFDHLEALVLIINSARGPSAVGAGSKSREMV